MTVNRAENSLDNKLVKTIAKHDRDIREIKAANQPIGADTLSIIAAPSGGALVAGPFTILAGSTATINFTASPLSQLLTLWNFAFTLYVDVLDQAHQWPGSADTSVVTALTTASREAFVFHWMDWADSSDLTNVRVFKVRIRNNDPGGVSHDYYMKSRVYVPFVGGVL